MEQIQTLAAIKVLMHGYWELPSDVTEDELDQYVAKVLRQVLQGDRVADVEFTLSRIQTNKLGLTYTKEPTRKLAEGVFDLTQHA